eukprot:PITA_17216
MVVEAPFQHWGLDFIGKFNENSSNGYSWIITATDYFTKWVAAIPTKHTTDKVMIDFLEDKIITRFGVLAKITTDNAKAFSFAEFSSFCFKYGIVLSHLSNYYPQGNGLAESSNKNFITIIKKIVGDNKRAWDSKIKYALIDQFVELDETKRRAFEHCCKNQSKVKRNFDRSSRNRMFSNNDMVLLWDRRNGKPGNHGKFDSLWLRPYIIREAARKNSYHLSTLDGEPLELPVNGQLLKLFYKENI